MREWTREEKYRYLKNPQEVKELYDSFIDDDKSEDNPPWGI